MHKRIYTIFAAVLFLFSAANAQKAEIAVSLNEQFFDALLDGVYQAASPIEFPLAANTRNTDIQTASFAFAERRTAPCKQAVQLLRENNGVRSAVRFREGKIVAPLAFSGGYSPPFVGCVPFAGYAETNIALEFDQSGQRLIARANVLNVVLNGTGGVGGSVIARMVQSSIDKKVNPIEIIRLDKVSFAVPMQNGNTLRMKATGMRHEIENGVLKIYVAYDFVR